MGIKTCVFLLLFCCFPSFSVSEPVEVILGTKVERIRTMYMQRIQVYRAGELDRFNYFYQTNLFDFENGQQSTALLLREIYGLTRLYGPEIYWYNVWNVLCCHETYTNMQKVEALAFRINMQVMGLSMGLCMPYPFVKENK